MAKVKYCVEHDAKFLVQSGGMAWNPSFTLHTDGVIIDLRSLSHVSFSSAERTEATVQAGATTKQVTDAAYAHDARLATGTCNSVGYFGALLGGGVGRTMGLYGPGVDQLLSARLVTHTGEPIDVDEKHNPDLFWAIRGAGPNFGIVTSAKVKAYPIARADNVAWTGLLVFTPDKIEALVAAIGSLDLQPDMQIHLYYATTGPPDHAPAVLALPFYLGNSSSSIVADACAAFAPIFDVGPVADQTTVLPYNQWNDAGDPFCARGGRKQGYAVSMNSLDPAAFRAVWDEYVAFLKNHPGTEKSAVLVECYPIAAMQSVPSDSSAYPFRHVKYHGIVIPNYQDPALDDEAAAFGKKVRDLWSSTDGLTSRSW
jgi:FAD/FMN-containing dehydrogenase